MTRRSLLGSLLAAPFAAAFSKLSPAAPAMAMIPDSALIAMAAQRAEAAVERAILWGTGEPHEFTALEVDYIDVSCSGDTEPRYVAGLAHRWRER